MGRFTEKQMILATIGAALLLILGFYAPRWFWGPTIDAWEESARRER